MATTKVKTVKKTLITHLPKPSKAQEVAAFRAEIQKYIETGSSAVLTAEERVKLFEQRKAYKFAQMPWYKREWENISSLWKK